MYKYFAESMQHPACIFDAFDIPWIMQNFHRPVLSRKVSLIFPIIYLQSDLQLICIFTYLT